MRIATCKRPLNITVLGNQGSVLITEGWHGDLDQPIGLTDRGPFTLADGLGGHLTEENFDLQTRAVKAAPVKPSHAAGPQTQEK